MSHKKVSDVSSKKLHSRNANDVLEGQVPMRQVPQRQRSVHVSMAKKREYTNEEVEWWSARVKYYLHEKNADITRAMDRASYDLKNRTQ